MKPLRYKYQTIEFGDNDIHLRTLKDKQQFSDKDKKAEDLGISVVNALSEWMEVEVSRQGKVWYQKHFRGKPVENAKEYRDWETQTDITIMAMIKHILITG